jgi:hypothetical protein
VPRYYLYCAGTTGTGDAYYVVMDQEVLIAGVPASNPVVGHGVLASGATGHDVTLMGSPRGERHLRAWYTVTRSGTVADELLAVLVAGSDTLQIGWQVVETRSFPVTAGSLPDVLGASAPVGGELPAVALGSGGRLENLDTGGFCDIGGDLTDVSITGIGLNSYTVLALDRSVSELVVVDARTCDTNTNPIPVGQKPVDVVTLGWLYWDRAWVANFDSDTITQVDSDGTTPTTIALGPPPVGACDKCPISMGVTERVAKLCEVVRLKETPQDTDMNGKIDRIRLDWVAVGCDSAAEFTVGCRCRDALDASCPCACDCTLPMPPAECFCPGSPAIAMGGADNEGTIQAVPPDPANENPWITLGVTPGGTFLHDIDDGNNSETEYSVESDDGG